MSSVIFNNREHFKPKKAFFGFVSTLIFHLFCIFLVYKIKNADIISFSYPKHCWFLILYSVFNSAIIAFYKGIDTYNKTELLRIGYTTNKLFHIKNNEKKFNLYYYMESVEWGLPMAFILYIIIWEPVSNHMLRFVITLAIGLLCGIFFVKSLGRTLTLLNEKRSNPNEKQ